MDQWLMYFAMRAFYFTSTAPGLPVLVPVPEVFSDLRFMTLAVKWYKWVLLYPGFYTMQVLLAAVIAGTPRWEVLLLAANSSLIYIGAFLDTLLKVDTEWSATGATGSKASVFNFIMVQIRVLVLMIGTSIVSIHRNCSMGHLNITTFQCVLNSSLLGAFVMITFLENRQKRREKTQPQHGLETAGSPCTDRQLVSVGRQSEALDAEAVLDARTARGTLVENPELQDRKGRPISWLNRLKLLNDIVIIVLIVSLLTLLFNQRQNQAVSIVAHVNVPCTVVASLYGGLVADQKRNPGNHVSADDQLFTVINPNLRDMATPGMKPTSTDGYKVDLGLGTITSYATIDDYLESFMAFEGSYIDGSGRSTETVSNKNKAVVATSQLGPSDYGRTEQDGKAAIHLPDSQFVEGRIVNVNIGTDETSKKVITEVTVASDGLQADDLTLLIR